MSVLSKIYVWDGEEWDLEGTTSGLTLPTGFDVSDSGKVKFWRVDTYDTETELTTVGDVWGFSLAPLIIFTWNFDLTGYDETLAWEVGVTEQWIPDGYTWDGSTLTPVSGEEWQFVDGEWQWSDEQNIVGGGRYQNKLVFLSHKTIFYEEY